MKLKKTIILTILLLAILAVGAASAADDNATSETLKLSEDSSESVLSETPIIFGNFTDLNNDINSGDEIELSSNYKYDSEKDRNLSSGINISTGKHIDGKGLTIDASNGAPIFNINGNGTLLKNIIFKNGANSAIRINNYCIIINCTFINCSGTDGGAISVAQYGSCIIAEGTFINCSATNKGGAIYIDGAYSRVSNSYFENCFARAEGGVIYWNGNEGSILNSTFTGSKAGIGLRFGGAIHWAGKNGIIKDSKFNNVTADDDGGAIYWAYTGENGILTDCTFTNTNANLKGGAIYWEGDDGIIKNSTFNNTNASSSGGAIHLEGSNGNVTGCTFNNTNSINDGGAIYIGTHDVFIANSTFTNTNTEASGGAIYFDDGETGIIFNCTFTNTNAKLDGGAIRSLRYVSSQISDSYFVNCSAGNAGGAIFLQEENGIIKNNAFENCSSNTTGGAIYLRGTNGNVINNTFTNTNATDNGGAIHLEGDNGILTGCTFTNTNGAQGGAIYWEGTDGNITDSTFENTISTSGGAIYLLGDNGILTGCTFTNTNAKLTGGAIHLDGENGNVTGCTFNNISAQQHGGAIYWPRDSGAIQYSKFINCFSEDGGAIYCEQINNPSIRFSHFENNTATEITGTGAVYNGNVSNCTFIGNTPRTLSPKTILNTTITATNSTCYIGGEIEITPIRITIDNMLMVGGEFDLYVNGKFNKTIQGENSKFTFIPKEAGEYRLQIKINATAQFYASESNVLNITSLKKDPAMTVSCDDITYGNAALILVTLQNQTTGNITFKVDNRTYYRTVNNSSCSINGLNAGTYNVTVTYSGDAIYKNATLHITLTVQKAEPSISVNPINSTYYGEDVIITAILPNDATGTLTTIVDGTNYTAIITSGLATFNITGLNAGTYNTNITYGGDSNYLAAQVAVQFSVSKEPTEIIVASNSFDLKVLDEVAAGASLTPENAGELAYISSNANIAVVENGKIKAVGAGTATITVSLAANDNYAAAESKSITVTVALNDASVAAVDMNMNLGDIQGISYTTTPDGLNVTFTADNSSVVSVSADGIVTALKAGVGKITLSVGDGSIYALNSTVVTVNVEKSDVVMTISGEDIIYGENAIITATMSIDDTLTVNINNQNIDLEITNGTGQIAVPNLPAGTYIANAQFAGNSNYNPANATTTITVGKKTPTVTATATVTGQNVLITVTTPNDATGTVTATVAGTNYNANINNATATFNLKNMNPGTYPATITYNGNNNYNTAQTNTSFTINKKTPTITATATVTGQNVLITVTTPNDATGTVTAIVDGKNYNANIINGKATFNLTNMNPGTYDATVSYPGDNNYLVAQNTTSFTVKSSKKTFADITSLINSASAGDVINLAGTYYGSGSIINVNKAVSIVGSENTVLDAGGLSGIMTVSSNNVKISNIKFVNGRLNSNGGAINWIGSNGILSNCTFENCSANNGGAVYWNSNDGQILNSKFINSRAKSGGAVYVSGNNEVVAASSIFKNNAEILNAPAYGSKLSNCIFEDCSADNGGSVYWNAKNGVIEETSFDSSKASANGGAVYWNSNDGQILDSEFTNSRAKNGGAVYVSGNNEVVVVSSIFENNNAEVLNGAVYGGKTKLCSFKNNTDSQINTRTILSLNETAIYIGNSISITTLVLNQQKGGLARGTVNLFINSKLVAAIDANDGFIFTPSEIGVYEVTAVFNENSEHHNSSDTATFSAIPIEIPEEISTSTEGVFTLEFPDDAEGTLTVFIDGTRYQVYNIVGGILNIDLTQFKGKHVITFEYGGDKNYPAFTKDVNVTVQTNPSISARNVNVQYLANQKYTIKVFKNKGIPAASTWVVIKLNNKAFKKLKTNKNGIVTFVVNQKPGTYKLKITSLRKTVQRTVKVKHVVTLKSTTLKKSARKLTLQATLAKVKGKYLIKKTITFRINGKKVATAKTNKRGIAKITIRNPTWLKKLKVGKKVTYQATYLKDTVKRTTKMRK